MANFKKNQPCSLFPYERTEIFSIQDASQKAGWMITSFDLPTAWLTTQGEGIKVAVIDTGCDMDHPDLIDNLLPGFNVLDPTKPPDDDNGHGTHCCGVIAAENNDIGMVGVAPKAKIIPIKALDKDGNGNLANVAKGIMIAISQGADIITMSLGSPAPVPQLLKVIQIADAKGIPVFVAAGNAGKTKDVYYPSAYAETISVGAIDETFKRASFSNTGLNLDFMAPGVNILSTVPDNWYAMMSGTSMATPFVAGIGALLMAAARKYNVPLSNVEAFRNKFREHTFAISGEGAGDDFFQGFGIISVKDIAGEWQVPGTTRVTLD
jgi:subtilisin family serine protease